MAGRRAGLIAGQADVEFAGSVDDNKLTALVVCAAQRATEPELALGSRDVSRLEPARRRFEDQRAGR